MKRFLLSTLLILSIAPTLSAQEIYTEIRRTAQAKVNDSSADILVRRFSMFKLEALNYMAIKMKEEFPDSSADLLDKEALSLNIFITNYTRSLIENRNMPANYQKKVIKAYMDASYSNPLFNDADKEMVLSYFNDGSSLTRFSLDTDWRRAVLAAKAALKQLDK
ncbi:hypothetical protein [Prevotella sp. E2-28]|uniref:hypothetical protein n=1 Tax=Prevotella sp. E2-28 TaxID=2913620 RepID=UPI001EDADF09|nr:hypothetical protein [Prevotella sp. E2-28]UKK52789.1 hypothetical protein L6465_09340 [Prevotella sp. E2-28]